jgi:hypothetical protein
LNRLTRPLMLASAALAMINATATRGAADLVFFTDETAFRAAAPALSTQLFSSANIAAIGISVVGNPLNSATNNAVFSAGSILPGLTITSSASHSGQDLGVVAPGVFGNTSKSVYNNFGGDSLFVSFAPSVTAVGMGLLNPNGTTVDFIVDPPSGSALGSRTVTVNSSGPPVFFGVVATNGDQIGRIELFGHSTSNLNFAGLDRVLFGATAVPEPSSFTLATAVAGLLALNCARRRRASAAR